MRGWLSDHSPNTPALSGRCTTETSVPGAASHARFPPLACAPASPATSHTLHDCPQRSTARKRHHSVDGYRLEPNVIGQLAAPVLSLVVFQVVDVALVDDLPKHDGRECKDAGACAL